jgi:glycosyltransferase involved in cell wall biosynthesis
VAIVAGNFAPHRLPRRAVVLHANLLAPAYRDYSDGDIPVHALTPRGTDRLKMLPIALRALPKVRRVAYRRLHQIGYASYQSVYLPRLRRLVERADVVHSLAHDYLGWTAQAAARQKGIPFVVTPFVHPHQWGDGPDDVAFYRRADAVIGLVETDTVYLESLGVARERLYVIGVSPDLPPTVDPVGFRERHGLGSAPVVLYVGRMMTQKGASAVVAASSLVWEEHPNTRVLFIGPGNVAQVAVFQGADARLKYLGKVSAQEKADALAACDVFCMPSMSEILPTVYLEAWSYGKPVVGGRAHGLPELVEGNGGGLSASQDPADVAAALSCLLGDPRRREQMGRAGKGLVERRYTVSAVTGQLEAVYEHLIAGGTPIAKEGAVCG